MKILVTGCNGFLGSNIVKALSKKDYEIIGTSLTDEKTFGKFYFEKGDLSNPQFARDLIKFYDPDVIINTVALTDVDRCEKSPEEAHKLNVLTAENITRSIQREDVKLIHISSDQLFDGQKSFYSEEESPSPINVYGITKLAAENSCLKHHKNTIIVRTNFFGWSPKGHKNTFAEWIIGNLREEKEINMFNNVFFSPIEISYLIEEIERLFHMDYSGILNIAGKERISKYEIGVKMAEEFGLDFSLIKSVEIDQTNFLAKRPLDMSLSVEKYERIANRQLPRIEQSIRRLKENFPQKVKNIIIGAGISGLSLAYHLEKSGEKDYLLLEEKNKIGGLCTSVREKGFVFDLSVHMLHIKQESTIELLKEILGDELILKERNAGILIKGKIIPYPIQYHLYHLDEETRKQWLKDILKISENPKGIQPKSFYEWIKLSQGNGLAENFMVPYNEKCYSTHPKNLSPDCGGKYVPTPNTEEIIKGASSDLSSMKIGYNHEFYYTKSGGISLLAEAFAKRINNIRLKEEVIKIDSKRQLLFTQNNIYSFDNLISTIPIKKLIKIIQDVPEEIEDVNNKLKYTKVCAVLLGINRPAISPYQWLYIPERDFLPYRLSFPMNYSDKMAPPGMSSICAEYSYTEDRKFTDEEIIERIIDDLIKIGLIEKKEEVIFRRLVEMNPGYVIFDFNREKSLKLVKDYLERQNIFSIGRYGEWQYSSMEDAIGKGKETAIKLNQNQ